MKILPSIAMPMKSWGGGGLLVPKLLQMLCRASVGPVCPLTLENTPSLGQFENSRHEREVCMGSTCSLTAAGIGEGAQTILLRALATAS